MAIRAIPADTSPEAFRIMVRAYRAMPAGQRLQMALRMSDDIMVVAAAGVRQRHPEYTEEQVRLALIRMRLGERLFHEVYGENAPT